MGVNRFQPLRQLSIQALIIISEPGDPENGQPSSSISPRKPEMKNHTLEIYPIFRYTPKIIIVGYC